MLWTCRTYLRGAKGGTTGRSMDDMHALSYSFFVNTERATRTPLVRGEEHGLQMLRNFARAHIQDE